MQKILILLLLLFNCKGGVRLIDVKRNGRLPWEISAVCRLNSVYNAENCSLSNDVGGDCILLLVLLCKLVIIIIVIIITTTIIITMTQYWLLYIHIQIYLYDYDINISIDYEHKCFITTIIIVHK